MNGSPVLLMSLWDPPTGCPKAILVILSSASARDGNGPTENTCAPSRPARCRSTPTWGKIRDGSKQKKHNAIEYDNEANSKQPDLRPGSDLYGRLFQIGITFCIAGYR